MVNLCVDRYVFCVLRDRLKNRLWSRIQGWSALLFALGLVSLFFVPLKHLPDEGIRTMMWVIFAYITIYLPKYIFTIFDLIARIPQLRHGKRIKILSVTGLVMGVLMFVVLWWGALFNRFNIDVEDVDVEIPGLPVAFDGFRIVQISDLHVGTYGTDTAFMSSFVDRINSLNPDIVLFTGDIVNRHTPELEPFVPVFSRLKAPYGVYSVLGNHDYGDYYEWPDTAAQIANNERLASLQAEMGWDLLRNEYRNIVVDGDTMVLIGVENIGDPPFHVYGDLRKAYSTPEDAHFKVLMTHNPAHWVKDVSGTDKNIALSLSGHTHAMQVELFGFSPAVFRYKTWGGLYNDGTPQRQLYVNIGAGTVGFPARIGATPEITLITLHGKGRK